MTEKLITKWICDVCKSEYDNETRAQDCESRHVHAIDITSEVYGRYEGYGEPTALIIKMSDGRTITYDRGRLAK